MPSVITVLGYDIPIYGICWFVGIFLAGIVSVAGAKKLAVERYDIVYSAVFAVIGGMIGSKLLFITVTLKTIIEENIPFINILKGGFVFYGGLIGGAVGLFIYTRLFKLPSVSFFDIYALSLPLGHAIGRVGCFVSGCCYGMHYDGPLSVIYTETLGTTPLNTPLLPLQLIEAAALLLIFVALILLFIKNYKPGLIASVYLYSYAVIRFVLEFFRGDAERGRLFVLSTSQIISILMIIITLFINVKLSKKRAVSINAEQKKIKK